MLRNLGNMLYMGRTASLPMCTTQVSCLHALGSLAPGLRHMHALMPPTVPDFDAAARRSGSRRGSPAPQLCGAPEHGDPAQPHTARTPRG